MSKYPSRDEILAELDYNEANGTFVRADTKKPSGTKGNGYWYDRVSGQLIPRSILVWIVEHNAEPKGRIRLESKRSDTRIEVLRDMGAREAWRGIVIVPAEDGSGRLDYFVDPEVDKENIGFMWRATLKQEGVKGLSSMTDREVYELARIRLLLS